MESDAIRSFIAVDLDDGARRAAAEVARVLREAPGGRSVRWVRPESLHVTLRFLGNVEPDRVAPLARCVGEQVSPLAPFTVRLGASGLFPTPRRPRVVVLALEPEEPLEELAAAVERGVAALGFEPETRRFRAHLTLGRLRGGRGPATRGLAAPENTTLAVDEVVLFRSELHPTGARYTALERLALRGGAANHP
jgi:2'-5' RNA ligase